MPSVEVVGRGSPGDLDLFRFENDKVPGPTGESEFSYLDQGGTTPFIRT